MNNFLYKAPKIVNLLDMLNVTLAQLNPVVGDITGNQDKLIQTVTNFHLGTPQLFIFPELFLMGYPPRDLLHCPEFLDQAENAIQQIKSFSKKVPKAGILVGSATRDKTQKNTKLYNSALLIHNGKLIFTQHKTLLPTYDVFDETRYFSPSPSIEVIPFYDEILGISICEDAWNPFNSPHFPLLISHFSRPYEINPIQILSQKGATLLINISASPFTITKEQERTQILKAHVKKLKKPFIYVNQVGANDELIFDGKSFYINEKGIRSTVLAGFKEDVQTIPIQHKNLKQKNIPCQEKIESVYQALILGIQDYFKKCGFTKALIGLSGGIDSALTTALAVKALGKKNVLGISMPSQYSSKGSVDDSLKLAKNLKIDCKIIPISDLMQTYDKTLKESFKNTTPGLAEENLQARIRGNLLMAFSNKYGYLVLSTGNKSELAMGYCTLYGDMSGGLSVLADIPKTMVYELAEYINKKQEIIPKNSIQKPPSAELKPNQLDQDTLPPYEILDQILHAYIEESMPANEIIKKGFDKKIVQDTIKTIHKSEYKRRQAAPGLKITHKSFGTGRRFPIAAKAISY